jgi:hypothetical protein
LSRNGQASGLAAVKPGRAHELTLAAGVEVSGRNPYCCLTEGKSVYRQVVKKEMFINAEDVNRQGQRRKEINNNNSIQFFIIYVPSQQLQGQLQTQHR